MVDHFDGDAAGFGFGERTRGVAVKGGPGFFVDLGFERGFKRTVWISGAQEIGVTDKEALFVVISVDKPTGDTIGAVAAHFTGVGVKHIDAVDLDAVSTASI